MLVGDRLRPPAVPVFVAIVGGLVLFGSSGLIFGPVVLAITVALVDVWRRRTAGGRLKTPSPLVSGRERQDEAG
jgi:predicted PurR-regulated permease PerM